MAMQEQLESLSEQRPLNDLEVCLLSVLSFDSEVQSGGLESFLSNSTCIYAHRIIDDLRTVGATRISARLNRCKETMARNGVGFLNVAEMDDIPSAAQRAMERFDNAYYNLTGLDALEYITAEFIRAHLNELPYCK